MSLVEKQAAAATGQVSLAHAWKEIMEKFGLNIAQILLAPDDTETRRKHLNARATLLKLIELQVIPVINENDTVSTEEIRFGDNDRLASRVAQISSADCLILLSDVNGLYSKDPKLDNKARLIREIKNINHKVENLASQKTGEFGSGGMKTKIDAAKICQFSGCHMAIANGLINRPIQKIMMKVVDGKYVDNEIKSELKRLSKNYKGYKNYLIAELIALISALNRGF